MAGGFVLYHNFSKWINSSLCNGPSLATASCWMCSAIVNELVHTRTRLMAESASSESVRIRMKRAPRLCCHAQRRAEFEVALRNCSRDANDDDSRIPRSNWSFPVHLHPSSRTSRQTKQLLAKVPFSCSCTFRGTVSRLPQWEPCSRRHPRNSPLQVEHPG